MSLMSPIFDAVAGQLIGTGLRIVKAAAQAVAQQLEHELNALAGGASPTTAQPTEEPGK